MNVLDDVLMLVFVVVGVVMVCVLFVVVYVNREMTSSGERRVACGVGFAAWMVLMFVVFLLLIMVVDFWYVELVDVVNEVLVCGGVMVRVSTLYAGLAYVVVGVLIVAFMFLSVVCMMKSYLIVINIFEWVVMYVGMFLMLLW